jgi:Zn-dependent peptidase ImmA (M78 family)
MARKAHVAAAALLDSFGIADIPIDPERVASLCGIEVVKQTFLDGEVSGMLLREEGRPSIIGVNASQAPTRQRFTLAHEIGHWRLHPGRLITFDRPIRINRRDNVSSMATDREEIEANAFAANLLMPETAVREMLRAVPPEKRHDSDLSTEWLAKQFDVSQAAMGFRLINLGLAT